MLNINHIDHGGPDASRTPGGLAAALLRQPHAAPFCVAYAQRKLHRRPAWRKAFAAVSGFEK